MGWGANSIDSQRGSHQTPLKPKGFNDEKKSFKGKG